MATHPGSYRAKASGQRRSALAPDQKKKKRKQVCKNLRSKRAKIRFKFKGTEKRLITTVVKLCGHTATTIEKDDDDDNKQTDHPDFGGGGHLAVRLKHPAVVREELLEDQAHGEDEQEPQHGAEEHSRHQHLTLRAHRLAVGGDRQKGCQQSLANMRHRLI